MTRGRLLELVTLMFRNEGRLHAGPTRTGNALVTIESGEHHTIYVDDVPLPTTGPGDERPVPAAFAHRVIAALRTGRGAAPDLTGEVLAYMQHARDQP